MNWIDKLERKFGRHGGIQNLTVYIIICYVNHNLMGDFVSINSAEIERYAKLENF